MRRTITGLLAIGLGLQGCGPSSTASNPEPNVAEDGGNAMNAAAPAAPPAPAPAQANSTAGGSAAPPIAVSGVTALANAEVARRLPRMDLSSRTIRVDEADDHWRVLYASPGDLAAGGPVIVHVDKQTRRAAIVQMPN